MPAKLKMAGGVGEATRAACHVSIFMVVVRARRSRGAQVSFESAVDFIPVRCKPVKGASVGNVWRVLAKFG